MIASPEVSNDDPSYPVQQMPRKRGRPRKIPNNYDGYSSTPDSSYKKLRDHSFYQSPPASFRMALKLQQKKAAQMDFTPVVRIGRPKMFTDDKIEMFESLMRTEKYALLWDRGQRGELGQRKIELFEEAAKEVTQLFNQEVTVQQVQRLFGLMKCKKSAETQKFQEQQLQRYRERQQLMGGGSSVSENGDADPNEFIPDPSSFVESVLQKSVITAEHESSSTTNNRHHLNQVSQENIPIPQLKIARVNSSGARYSLPTPSPSIETGSIDEERLQLERDILRLQKLAAQRQVELLELQIQQAKELHEIKISSLHHKNQSSTEIDLIEDDDQNNL